MCWGLTGGCVHSGLAVDYHNERLYWADAKLSVIGSIRLNGTDPVVAIDNKKGKGCPVGVPASDPPQIPASTCPLLASPGLSHPFSIDIFEDYIYGVTYINNRIFKIHKFGHKAVTNLTSGLNHATDVVLYHQYKQPEGVCGPGTPTLLPLGWEGGARAWYLM